MDVLHGWLLVEAVPRSEAGDPSSEHYGAVSHLAFSSDGQLMASCGEDARLERGQY